MAGKKTTVVGLFEVATSRGKTGQQISTVTNFRPWWAD
jgi:hypothetical protein